ncbi:hypothetical protein ACJ41O_014757 [Fusarium nematophilum]
MGQWLLVQGTRDQQLPNLQVLESRYQAVLSRGIVEEIRGRIHGPAQGFLDRALSDTQLVEAAVQREQCHEKPRDCQEASCDRWTLFQFRLRQPGQMPQGNRARGEWDLSPIPAHSALVEGNTWNDVQVVGFQVHAGGDEVEYLLGFLRLCKYAREVFRSQPERLFLHGFCLFGSEMERWVFGRRGLYSSQRFDAGHRRVRLINQISDYERMNDQELGIRLPAGNDGRYAFVDAEDGSGRVHQLDLLDEPIWSP